MNPIVVYHMNWQHSRYDDDDDQTVHLCELNLVLRLGYVTVVLAADDGLHS